MDIVPVIDSTIETNYIRKTLQVQYGLSVKTNCKLFRTGINHSYIITDNGQQYVFRIYSYNWRTEVEILEELKLLISLKKQLSVSYPIPSKHDKLLLKFQAPEGLRYGALFSYAKGKKVRSLTMSMLEQIGTWIGIFHQLTVSKSLQRVDYNANTLTTLPYEYAKDHFSETLAEMEYLKKVTQQSNKLFEQLDKNRIKTGIIHLDIWNDNIHIAETGITVFDFDFCGNGHLALDVAYFMTQLFHAEPNKEIYETKVATFLKSYESIRPLSKEEKIFLPHAGIAIWIFYLGVQSRRFDNWSNIFLTEMHLKRFVGMIQQWADYYKI